MLRTRIPALTLALLGAVSTVLVAAPAEASTPAPAGTTLSVFAYNVDLATAAVDTTTNENAAGRTPTVEAVIRKHDADVVILDELFNQTSSDQIPADLQAEYPYHTPNVGQVCSGGGWDGIAGDCSNSPTIIRGGTMILSKYPIMAQFAYVFGQAASWDWFSNKGAVLAEVDKNGTRTWVVGTHLQADQAGTAVSTTEAVRNEQMADISSWVDSTVGTQGPVLIGGDLNTNYFGGQVGRAAGDSDFNRIEAAGDAVLTTMEDPNAQVLTVDCTVSAWCKTMSGIESFSSTERDSLDYTGYLNYTDPNGVARPTPSGVGPFQVLFDPQAGWTPGQLDTYAPSDHYPVETTFTIGQTAMPAVDWNGLNISGGDDQRSGYLLGQADWDSGAAKGSCVDGERLIGLSYTGDEGECTDAVAGTGLWDSARDYTVVHGESYVTNDWAYGYTKAQCPANSYVTGWSRDGSTIGVLCAKADTTLGTAQQVLWFNGGDNRVSSDGGDWAYGNYKGQCADNEYIAGVAYSHHWYSSNTGQPWALLCSPLS